MLTASTTTNTATGWWSQELGHDASSTIKYVENISKDLAEMYAKEKWFYFKPIQKLLGRLLPGAEQVLEQKQSAACTKNTEANMHIPLEFKLDAQTTAFIEQYELIASIRWLENNILDYFLTTDYDFSVNCVEEDGYMLSLRIYNTQSRTEFRQQRRNFCNAMKAKNFINLHNNLMVSQWRVM